MQYQEIVNEQGERFLLPLLAVGAAITLPFWLARRPCCIVPYPVAYPTYFTMPYPYPYPMPKPYPYPLPPDNQQTPIPQGTLRGAVRP